MRGVGKTVGEKVHIYPTDLTLESGSMNVLLGPTLSGKTTLMRLMAGLEEPTVGRIFNDGNDVTGMRVQDRQVAMVYQQFINYPTLTVYDNIASPLRLQGRSKDEIDREVRKVAEMVKLSDQQLDRKPLELSGGQQQRCALARALVKGAGLVLLDEPLANLDYKLREELREEIPRIFRESGAIFVYATTEPHEALLLGGTTICLWEGRVTQSGPTAQVYRAPSDATTARVFSDPPMNFLDLDESDGVTGQALRALELGRGTYLAGFRPNHLYIDRPSDDALAFPVEILGSEITGSETFVHVGFGGRRWTALAHGVRDISAGEQREVFVEPRHVYVFDENGALERAAPYAQG